ncbi:MAG: T9SS type A sorting domain-containing protein [Saprospiraceae bacterium]|nr:T9SS type A sorting domain-containing protein [Saprospiraceae bacterium]
MNHISKLFLATFLLFSFLFPKGAAQTTTDYFTVASTAGPGLSDIRIMDLAGFGPKLWLATDGGGVNTFDGANWEVITQEDGLPTDRTTTIVFDQQGTPWVGTRGPGVATLEGDQWKVFRKADGLSDGWISCSMRDSDGRLWFGTRRGISVYDSGTWSTFTMEDGILAEYISDIFQDADGMIWVATSGGVNKYDGNTWSSLTTDDGLINNNVQAINQDKNGDLWFGTWGGGVSILSGGTWTNPLEFERVRAITRDGNGDMFIAVGNGMYFYDYTDFNFTSFEEEDDLHGYGNIINDIIVDNNQNIFAATWNVLVFANSQGWNRFEGEIGLCSNSIYRMNEDNQGRIWMASSSRGLSIYDDGEWEVYNYINTFEGERIYDVFRDSKDEMWVATSGGAYRYMEGQWQRLTTDDGLLHNVTYSIYEDSKGRYWFGTFGGLTVIDGNDIMTLTPDDGLIDNSVYHILEDANGHFWFGTNSGLSLYDGAGFTNFTQGSEIPANQINDLQMDANQDIWIATNSGVSKYDGSQWQILQMPEISNNSVYTIMPEENGSVWIGTFNGINRYQDGVITKYFSNDGTLYHNSVQTLFKASDGQVWAATFSDGVFVMDFTTPTRDQHWGPEFQIYPNPVVQELHLSLPGPVHGIRIIDVTGLNVLEKLVEDQQSIDIKLPNYLSPGIYTVVVKYESGHLASSRFIKVD